jgi:hypothetical protein
MGKTGYRPDAAGRAQVAVEEGGVAPPEKRGYLRFL